MKLNDSHRLVRLSAVVAAIMFATACSGSDGRSPASGVGSPAVTESTRPPAVSPGGSIDVAMGADEVTDLIEGFVGNRDGGVVVLLTRSGETTMSAAGAADSAGTPIGPEDVFRVGSLSKPFIATIVLQLVDEGRIALGDPLGQHLPRTDVGADASIEQLLGHRSGVPNYTDQPAFFADALADPSRTLMPDEILAYIDGVELGLTGEFAYSNTNYILLGQLIEQLDGTDLNTSLANRITNPLRLTNTHFETPGNSYAGVAAWSPGLSDGGPATDYTSVATGAWAAGALVSTTSDLARFLQALSAGELMSAESLRAMTDTSETGYGLGVFEAVLSAGRRGYGHSGAIPGYTATMAIDAGTGDTIVILTNNDSLIADGLAPRLLG